MNFNDLLGQSHVAKVGAMIIASRPTGVLITGPVGCGKTTYARILVEGLNGDGAVYHEVPSCIEGDWSLLDSIEPSRQEWGKLVSLMEEHPDHCFVLTTSDVDTVPRGVQSRCVRVPLKTIPSELLIEFTENYLVQKKLDYDAALLPNFVARFHGDLRALKTTLRIVPEQGLDSNFIQALKPSLVGQATELLCILSKGELKPAQDKAEDICSDSSPFEFVKAMITAYLKIWEGNDEAVEGVKCTFPHKAQSLGCLLKWSQPKLEIGITLGPQVVEDLWSTGVLVNKPTLQATPKPSTKSTPSSQVLPEVMDPRVRERLRAEEEARTKAANKASHFVPSSIILEETRGDGNPFGLRMPPPKDFPKDVLVGSDFAKLTRAQKLSPEEKWDLVYKEESIRKNLLEKIAEFQGHVLNDSDGYIEFEIPESILQEES
jgi:DNA polymerase III gamma/tau subunit